MVEAVPLDITPERVLDIDTQDGEVALLVVNAQARTGWGLYRVRLGAEGAAPLPVRWPRGARAADFALDTLVEAGFSVGRGTSPYVGAAAFDRGTLLTGGDTRGAGWADLALPDASGATLTVDADISEWHDGCGQPELLLSWGLRRWRLLLAADPPRLQVDHETPVPIAGAAHGAQTWTLSVDADRVSVSIDGAVVHEGPLGTAPEGPTWVSVGQRTSCGQPLGPATVWRSVSVDGR